MTDYEIRLLTAAGATIEVVMTSLAGDFVAIRRAQSLKTNGQGIQVWRGRDCIYTDAPPAAARAEALRHGV